MLATDPTARTAVTEVLTESATAEIAVAGVLIAVALFAVGAFHRSTHPRSVALRCAGLVLALITLSAQVRRNGWLTSADSPVTDSMVNHRTAMLDQVAKTVTSLGSPTATVVVAVALGAVVSWQARSALPGIVVIGTVGGASVICSALKALIARERPPVGLHLLVESDHSFPSGHVTGTGALAGIAVVVLGAGLTATVRRTLAVLAVAVTILVGLTRVYLGVHWLSDVVAGAVLATLAVTVGAALLRFLHNRRSAPAHGRSAHREEIPV
ncbi:membrane-associated phospholipid phosphatase [Rhodococcus sp. 27YEA15]|uniref:phosphatase PAP2 family protein n=1 Tax=Rhodococcus sp. 27YEA15 TaxID=3156259 RepID=UPI003C7C2D35